MILIIIYFNKSEKNNENQNILKNDLLKYTFVELISNNNCESNGLEIIPTVWLTYNLRPKFKIFDKSIN